MATRVFSYNFEMMCNLKPLEPVPEGATQIAPGVYRLPVTLDGSVLVKLADWRGTQSTPAYVRNRWQYFFQVRTLRP